MRRKMTLLILEALVGVSNDSFDCNLHANETTTGKKTEEGFSVYTFEELGMNENDEEGGDTPLCPFDCTCCGCILAGECSS